MPKIKFINESKEIEVPTGANLREAALAAGLPVYRRRHKLANCQGKGVCGTCRMLVVGGTSGNCAPMGRLEKLRLRLSLVYIGYENEMRLSCQTKVQGDIQILTVPPLNLNGEK